MKNVTFPSAFEERELRLVIHKTRTAHVMPIQWRGPGLGVHPIKGNFIKVGTTIKYAAECDSTELSEQKIYRGIRMAIDKAYIRVKVTKVERMLLGDIRVKHLDKLGINLVQGKMTHIAVHSRNRMAYFRELWETTHGNFAWDPKAYVWFIEFDLLPT